MTSRNIVMSVTPRPTSININADDPEHSSMGQNGTLVYMLTIEGDTAAGTQTISVREGVMTTTIGPFNAGQLRKLGRTLIRKADEHDQLMVRFKNSDDALGLSEQTISLCEMTIGLGTHDR